MKRQVAYRRLRQSFRLEMAHFMERFTNKLHIILSAAPCSRGF
jgi:hypothetical protein